MGQHNASQFALGRKRDDFKEGHGLLKGRVSDQFQPTSERHAYEEKHILYLF